MATTNKMLH